MQTIADPIITLTAEQKAERYTPKKYADLVHRVYESQFDDKGEIVSSAIELDPASCLEANKTIRANCFYSKQDNGLLMDWFGKIFLNPPYSNMDRWVSKMIWQLESRNTKSVILLANASIDTEWFHSICRVGDEFNGLICHVKGRIKFYSPYKKPKEENGPDRSSIFIYLGGRKTANRFTEIFSEIGHVAEL